MPDYDSQFIGRLRQSMEESKRRMRAYNKNRVEALEVFVGRHYVEGGEKVPFPTLYLGTIAYMAHLVGGPPAAMVTTEVADLRPMAHMYQLAGDRLFQEIDLEDTYSRGVMAALFGLCIFKCGMAQSKTVEIGGYLHDVGQPFCDVVSQENWMADPMARRFEEAQWMGDRYRMRLDHAREMFDNPDDLKEWEGPEKQSDEVEELSGTKKPEDQLYPMTEVADIWLPDDGVILTVGAGEGAGTKVQRTVEWEGPEHGPYVPMSFTEVPDNILPLPPVAVWRDMDIAINQLGRKVLNQILRQKEIVVATAGHEDDADTIKRTADGEMSMVRDLRAVMPLAFGGAASNNLATVIWMLNHQGKNVGNLDLMAGTGDQAETLGQSEMMQGSIGKRMQMMGRRRDRAAERVAKNLFWYLAYDPLIEMGLTARVAGVDIPVQFNADMREGDWLDFNFKIVPYSMERLTPQMKVQRALTFWERVLMPSMQLAMMQGITFNVETYAKLMGKLLQVDEADELVFSQGKVPTTFQPQQAIGRPPSKHESVNVSNRGGQGASIDNQMMAQAMQGEPGRPPGSQQNAQMAGMPG